MLAAKRKSLDAGRYHEDDGEEPPAKRSHSLDFNARAPWLQSSRTEREWRTLGNRAVQPSLPLANMVTAVQDLIDPEFDPLIAILDDEPRFLKPLPSRMAPEDLEFLRIRGALSIPESGLRNELLRCYIKWVHSFMPVLNLQKFLFSIAQNDPNGNISLLLFQAVMFVATAFIDFKHLHDAGYTTRKNARNAFYTRLRLLYSLDCEEDRVAIIQTLLLMTYWSDHANHPRRDIWDWIGVCNTQAQSIGLNRDPASAPNMDPSSKRLRTRLWWCLYSRDRLIAMGLRRPSQLNEGTSNIPLLKLDDFDFEAYHPSVTAMFHCRQLEDVSHQKRLATMFIEKTKLCQCIGRVLFAQYSPSQCQFGTTTRTTITLVPRLASESELARCSQKLESWLNGLPKDAQFIPESRNTIKEGEGVLLLHSAMLRMLYHATISALYRPWATNFHKNQSKARQELMNTARAKMHDSALGITHIVQGLNQLDLTRFLPQSGVTVILPAAVAHLTNSKSDNPTVRETSLYNFQRCVQVLQGLKDIYPAADMEVANIEAAVKVQSDNTNAFLRIMQYSSSNSDSGQKNDSLEENPENPPNKDIGEQHRKQSTVSDLQSTTATKPSPSPTAPTPAPSQQHRNNSYTDFNNHLDHLNLDTPPTDFLSLDIPNPPFDFAAPTNLDQNISPSDPDPYGIDWTQELLAGAMDSEYGGSGFENERRDAWPFSPDNGSTGIGSATGHTHTPADITGDLDRDLGLCQ
ncbi:transcription factor domain-containing protein [Aspergillus chevalieri]|uniref:Xylanolytic transcriptional activator regulatory domain-containing protein n=1 Tax=Aspergillus chevalieri TaxID=182096 RepID=A0A7R7VW13_ASPCH|nr:uncharacterized protein ACHE_70669A [Aspergillus chevalieri]BCR91826.1 hypothetical protein ACHE_70669A [Aspergillus chevalieri]